ncbi:MAG: DUF2066 domain-containing protein [Rhizobiales bacterium]|nr:DUF2066 domain-containing protein [Hyphomicrobiales bacterium]MDQ3558496.1 DUF2066 domain-containing protein [Pseudomonadota bacterium]
MRHVSVVAQLLALLLMLACGTADAENLYQAQTIVTGQGEENRVAGLAQALKDLLVKVSGDPTLVGDPRLDTMARQVGAFVREFRYRDRMAGIPVHDEQGTRDRPYDLAVRFHPQKVDAALRSLGRKPWTAARPRVVVFLGVDNGATTYMLAIDGDRGRDQRDALSAAAERLGMPMAVPDQAALIQAGITYQNLPAADLAMLDTVAKAVGGDLALAGKLVWSDEALGWIAGWRLASEGHTYHWQIRGVSFDEAFRSAMRGAAQILSGHGAPN